MPKKTTRAAVPARGAVFRKNLRVLARFRSADNAQHRSKPRAVGDEGAGSDES